MIKPDGFYPARLSFSAMSSEARRRDALLELAVSNLVRLPDCPMSCWTGEFGPGGHDPDCPARRCDTHIENGWTLRHVFVAEGQVARVNSYLDEHRVGSVREKNYSTLPPKCRPAFAQ